MENLAVPEESSSQVLLKVLRIGICGTDREIIAGFYGQAPDGLDYLVLGHESLCRIESIGMSVKGFKKGDLVVPTVRRNCPENCVSCRNGESDMCYTGHYKEHGLKQLNGFASEFAISDASFVVKLPESLSEVGVLLEPLTVVEKALLQTQAIQNVRLKWKAKKALVLGAGPVGLLATAILRLRGIEVDTVATRSEESVKARLVRTTGATYVNSKETPLSTMKDVYDVVFEVTGNPEIALQAQDLIRINGIVCYLGIYREEQETQNVGKLFTDLVLGNRIHFGSVNANKTYFEAGAKDLVKIQREWPGYLQKMITRKERPDNPEKAYSPESEEEIKTIIEF